MERSGINPDRTAWWNHPKRASHDGGLHPVPPVPTELYERMNPELQRLVRYYVGAGDRAELAAVTS